MTNFARSFAKELSSDPFVREALSRFCWKHATISSTPTKAGVKEICSDPTHRFFGIHRFVKKPVSSFSDVDDADDTSAGDRQGIAFLDLVNAAHDRGGKDGKLVEYVINLDNSSLERDDQVTLISSNTEFYISSLPGDIDADRIESMFETGAVKEVHIVANESQLDAFVTFSSAGAARSSIKRKLVLNGERFVSHNLSVLSQVISHIDQAIHPTGFNSIPCHFSFFI